MHTTTIIVDGKPEVVKFHAFPGPNATDEKIAEQVKRALEQIATGDFDPVDLAELDD